MRIKEYDKTGMASTSIFSQKCLISPKIVKKWRFDVCNRFIFRCSTKLPSFSRTKTTFTKSSYYPICQKTYQHIKMAINKKFSSQITGETYSFVEISSYEHKNEGKFNISSKLSAFSRTFLFWSFFQLLNES